MIHPFLRPFAFPRLDVLDYEQQLVAGAILRLNPASHSARATIPLLIDSQGSEDPGCFFPRLLNLDIDLFRHHNVEPRRRYPYTIGSSGKLS